VRDNCFVVAAAEREEVVGGARAQVPVKEIDNCFVVADAEREEVVGGAHEWV
jgi:hypothetical protein